MTHIQVQNYKIHASCLLKYTHIILCLVFLMCVATMHYQTTVDKNLKPICSLWYWNTGELEIRWRSSNLVWIVWPQARLYSCQVWKTSLKQCQPKSYQTWYELVDPKQAYNHAKFERPPLNSVNQKAIKPGMICLTPSKVIIMPSLKNLS